VDITDAKTDEGFPYLAFVLGVYSRRIAGCAGWSTGSHLGTGLVIDAPEMTAWRRKPTAGLVYHSDRSTRYMALSFGKRLEEVGIVPSIRRTGSRRWTTPPR
jgi:transposase InsO family protein